MLFTLKSVLKSGNGVNFLKNANIFRFHRECFSNAFIRPWHWFRTFSWKYSKVYESGKMDGNEATEWTEKPTRILICVENRTFVSIRSNFSWICKLFQIRIYDVYSFLYTISNFCRAWIEKITFRIITDGQFNWNDQMKTLEIHQTEDFKWWQVWKRDETSNAMCLCAIFHGEFQWYWMCVCIVYSLTRQVQCAKESKIHDWRVKCKWTHKHTASLWWLLLLDFFSGLNHVKSGDKHK